MSTPAQVEAVMEKRHGGVGRCKFSFWFAVGHDILGSLIMLVGVFGGLVIHDLFIYAGAIIIFLSLIWWVFWYTGNIDVPPEELEDDVGLTKQKKRGLGQVVRHMSNRISSGIRSSFRGNGTSTRERSVVSVAKERATGPSTAERQQTTDVPLSVINESTSSSKGVESETLSV